MRGSIEKVSSIFWARWNRGVRQKVGLRLMFLGSPAGLDSNRSDYQGFRFNFEKNPWARRSTIWRGNCKWWIPRLRSLLRGWGRASQFSEYTWPGVVGVIYWIQIFKRGDLPPEARSHCVTQGWECGYRCQKNSLESSVPLIDLTILFLEPDAM
jgi:hypothetical protein